MNRTLRMIVALTLASLAPGGAAAAGASTGPQPYAGAQFRYWAFSNANDLRDVLAYWVPGPFHVQLEVWDFVRGNDQFRPEVGLHLRDARRSVYTLQWRHERDAERYRLGTDQVLSRRLVGRVEVSPIVAHQGGTDWVYAGGLDYYWADYDFVTATVIRDPRGGGLWVVPLRLRLADRRNDWVQFTVAPASRRTLGWALDAKLRWLRLGVERNSRYDFADVDNVIWTAGVEVPVPAQ
jgi:hypothetical protein